MPGETNTPNMSLPVPGVGVTPGPAFATDVNACMAILDQHNHSAGSGVAITPTGLNISSDLSFLGNNATVMRSSRYSPQAAFTLPADIGAVYVSGVDLYFRDINGTNIRMTASGGVAGTPGSIANLVAPASATYVSGSSTFVWQSNTLTPANLDAASILLRNLSASSNALTLNPPSAMGSNFSITLPNLPVSTMLMTLDSSGNMGANVDVDNSTLEISSGILRVKDAGITGAKIASATITGSNIAAATITGSNIDTATVTKGNIVGANYATAIMSNGAFPSGTVVGTVNITSTGRPVIVTVQQTVAGTAITGGAALSLNVLRDGTIVPGVINRTGADVDGVFRIDGGSVIDVSVGAGSHTYQIFVSLAGNFAVGASTRLTAYEIT